ncbi:hypothetical protein OG21DRAFT_1482320 [Imleria badia]|nr:hypothetical protein OG21DRAFT_1482320 [Imleria badia]
MHSFPEPHIPQAIIVFMAGEHNDAISRIDDLIDSARQINILCGSGISFPWKPAYGESRLRGCETVVRVCPNATPRQQSTFSGLTGELHHRYNAMYRNHSRSCRYLGGHLITFLYAAGRIKEADESLLNIVNTIDEDVYATGPIINWVSGKLFYPAPPLCIRHFATDFLQRFLSTPESRGDTTLHSPTPVPLLREWARLKLTGVVFFSLVISLSRLSWPPH